MDQVTAQTNLDAALAALAAATTAQGYSVGDLSVQRAPLDQLRANVAYWQRAVNQYAAASAGATSPGAAYAAFK